ncbi:hypothetical protein QQ045_006178 [Rhodiola kirilowii]
MSVVRRTRFLGFGIVVHDECKLKFVELKAKRIYRFIIFGIEAQQVVEKLGSPEETYEDFTNSIPANECHYTIFKGDITAHEFFIAGLIYRESQFMKFLQDFESILN